MEARNKSEGGPTPPPIPQKLPEQPQYADTPPPPDALRYARRKRKKKAEKAASRTAKAAPPPEVADEDEDEGNGEFNWNDKFQELIDGSPPWAISFVVHLLMLIILALIVIHRPAIETVLLVLDPSLATEGNLDDNDLQLESTELDIETPEISFDEMPVDDPLASLPEIDVQLTGLTPIANFEASSIGAALEGRNEGSKQQLLAKYGGTETTELSVAMALDWLARQQKRDGSWSLTGPYSDGAVLENRTAAIAMSLLAFQGAGMTPKVGKYKANVARGVDALVKLQDGKGNFYQGNETHQQLYAHAQAMIAICELYGMTKDPKYKEPAEKSIQYAIASQDAAGGWRYEPGRGSDLSVTGWFLMGLQSARMAGLNVPQEVLYKLSEYLDTVAADGGSRYRYRPGEAARRSMTAEGLLCRQYLGWEQNDPRLRKGVQVLVTQPINYSQTDVYYWYYATQVCHHQEGSAWTAWNAVMREEVPKAQVKNGQERGSWGPRTDQWGSLGGRLYTTCLSTYMLEVYYRHLPIYSYRKKPLSKP